MIRVVLAIPLTLALLLLTAAPSAATTTTTETFKDVTFTFVSGTPCTDGLATITTTSNGVMHTTVLDNGTVHGTFTQTGTFSLVPLDPTAQTISGHFAIWGGFNQNANNIETTFTFNATGRYADGTRFGAHTVDHINTSASDMLNMFNKLHC